MSWYAIVLHTLPPEIIRYSVAPIPDLHSTISKLSIRPSASRGATYSTGVCAAGGGSASMALPCGWTVKTAWWFQRPKRYECHWGLSFQIWLKAANHFAILRLSLLGLFWSKTLGISWCIHDFFGVNFEIWKPNLEILCLASDHAENTHGRPTCHWKIAINRNTRKTNGFLSQPSFPHNF